MPPPPLKPVTFAYLIPNFSNPTGYLVSEEQRSGTGRCRARDPRPAGRG